MGSKPAPTPTEGSDESEAPPIIVALDSMLSTAVERRLLSLGLARTRVIISLLVGLSATLYQNNLLGRGFNALHNLAALLLLSLCPLLTFIPLPRVVPRLLAAVLAPLPVLVPPFLRLVHDLCTGHTRPGSQWYHAVWRIYAIVFLWLLAAVANETKIRPLLRARARVLRHRARAARSAGSDTTASGERVLNTVQSRAHAMRMAAREDAWAEIDAKVAIAERQRRASAKAIAAYARTVETAERNVQETEKMVQQVMKEVAKARVAVRKGGGAGEGTSGEDKTRLEEAEKELEKVKSLAEGAVAHEEGLAVQLEAHKLVIADSESKLAELQKKRIEAADLDQYGFFR